MKLMGEMWMRSVSACSKSRRPGSGVRNEVRTGFIEVASLEPDPSSTQDIEVNLSIAA